VSQRVISKYTSPWAAITSRMKSKWIYHIVDLWEK
jgi:hypothetical protein